MKSNKLIILILILLLICIGLSVYLFIPRKPQVTADIVSFGKTIQTVSLNKNDTFTINTPGGGYNTIVIQDGKIAVTDASCPDHVCIGFGWCSSGMPIVCLPNSLIIEFRGANLTDSVSG